MFYLITGGERLKEQLKEEHRVRLQVEQEKQAMEAQLTSQAAQTQELNEKVKALQQEMKKVQEEHQKVFSAKFL